jgi:hypothetical protein
MRALVGATNDTLKIHAHWAPLATMGFSCVQGTGRHADDPWKIPMLRYPLPFLPIPSRESPRVFGYWFAP